MIQIGVFELISGKTFLTRYELGESGEFYTFEKPMTLTPVQGPKGERGFAISQASGLYPTCVMKESAVIGLNLNAVDKQLVDQYIRVTSAIAVASELPPGAQRRTQ